MFVEFVADKILNSLAELTGVSADKMMKKYAEMSKKKKYI
jgi:hypothetical protein